MLFFLPPLFGSVTTWLTPIWVLGLGALLGTIVLLCLWGILALLSRKWAAAAGQTVREGILWPILNIVLFLATIGVVASFSVNRPLELISSLSRLPNVGTKSFVRELPAPPADPQSDALNQPAEHAVAVSFRLSELQWLVFESTEDISVSTRFESDDEQKKIFRVTAGESDPWFPPQKAALFFPEEEVDTLYMRNLGADAAQISVSVVTDLTYPEVRAIPIMAIFIVALFAIYIGIRVVFPKISAIAFSTSKSEIAQPQFFVALSLGIFLLLVFIFIPYNTFGEDVKMLKDSGLTLIMVLSLLVAVYAAGTSVAEEIEGRTALTVLSKPVSRRQFVFGKFLGIIWVLLLIFLVLGILFLGTISYKVVYDARETANPDPIWQDSYREMIRTIPGLVLVFFETVVLTSLSVAISTRLPLLANFVVMFSVYVLGHLTPLIVHSAIGKLEPVVFVGRLIATVVPVLDHFNVQAAVAAGVPVPLDYLGLSLVYCVLYSSLAMLLALTLFEDRDLA